MSSVSQHPAITVTPEQVTAAKLMVGLAKHAGKMVDPAIVAISRATIETPAHVTVALAEAEAQAEENPFPGVDVVVEVPGDELEGFVGQQWEPDPNGYEKFVRGLFRPHVTLTVLGTKGQQVAVVVDDSDDHTEPAPNADATTNTQTYGQHA